MGQQQPGNRRAVAAVWPEEAVLPLCQRQVGGKTLPDVPSSLPALLPPSLPFLLRIPRDAAPGMAHLLLTSESWGCVLVQREKRAKQEHRRCLSLQGTRIAAGALSGPVFLRPLVFFPLLQSRSSMATQEINLLIDLPEGPGM